jgi:hypothetical protein
MKQKAEFKDTETKNNILKKINIALDIFYNLDFKLIELNVQERAISHKFACYLQELFKNYDVDCEYDKHEEYTKKLDNISECSEEKKTNRILPDIIVHKRKIDDHNLAVFEIKSKQSASSCDIKKLELMTKQDGQFKYKFGFFIKFGKERKDCKIEVYINGEKQE